MVDLKIAMDQSQSNELRRRLRAVIPGGAHTYAKGDDQFPEHYAPVLVRGKGCTVWDADGNEYIEYGMGLRSVSLGHSFAPVVEAAYKQMQLGSNFVRPAAIEAQAAEALLDLIPAAKMVKFGKNGSDATTAAVKLARAYTGRASVAICKNHPFFSVDDWFIGTTAVNSGIPKTIIDLTLSFEFNNIESVRDLFDRHSQSIACLIMEPEKDIPLESGFIKATQELCRKNGALLILDEMITGLRWHLGGAQTLMGLEPDLSTFGKALGNGFSVSALLGKRKIMELGGLEHDKDRVFLMSTTHGAEYHCLAAMMEVIRSYQQLNVIEHLRIVGERLRVGMQQCIDRHGLDGFVGVHGHPACLIFSTCDQEGKRSQPFRTLFLQELIKRGIIAPNLVISYSHSESVIDQTIDILDQVMKVYLEALQNGVDQYLEGRSVQPVYRRRNHQ